MIAFDLAHTVRDSIAANIEVENLGDDRLVVYMPFIYDDGDQCSIFLTKDSQSGWLLSDQGEACKRASELGFDLAKNTNTERLQKLTEFYGVTQDGTALGLSSNRDELAESLFALTQTCLEATWLPKSRVVRSAAERQDFSKKFEELVFKAAPQSESSFNWHDPVHDPKRIYPVDCHLTGKERQLFLFGVQNPAACMRATITCQHYRIEGANFDAVAIYDKEEEIPKRYTDQLNELVLRRFPRIVESKQIIRFLKGVAA